MLQSMFLSIAGLYGFCLTMYTQYTYYSNPLLTPIAWIISTCLKMCRIIVYIFYWYGCTLWDSWCNPLFECCLWIAWNAKIMDCMSCVQILFIFHPFLALSTNTFLYHKFQTDDFWQTPEVWLQFSLLVSFRL